MCVISYRGRRWWWPQKYYSPEPFFHFFPFVCISVILIPKIRSNSSASRVCYPLLIDTIEMIDINPSISIECIWVWIEMIEKEARLKWNLIPIQSIWKILGKSWWILIDWILKQQNNSFMWSNLSVHKEDSLKVLTEWLLNFEWLQTWSNKFFDFRIVRSCLGIFMKPMCTYIGISD